jgi:hypothetical protein
MKGERKRVNGKRVYLWIKPEDRTPAWDSTQTLIQHSLESIPQSEIQIGDGTGIGQAQSYIQQELQPIVPSCPILLEKTFSNLDSTGETTQHTSNLESLISDRTEWDSPELEKPLTVAPKELEPCPIPVSQPVVFESNSQGSLNAEGKEDDAEQLLPSDAVKFVGDPYKEQNICTGLVLEKFFSDYKVEWTRENGTVFTSRHSTSELQLLCRACVNYLVETDDNSLQ